MRYAAGWNMCGYMPHVEPEIFGDFDSAKSYIIENLKQFADEDAEAGSEDTAEGFCHAAEDVNLESSEFTYIVNGYAFWVAETEEVADEDE